MMQVFAGVVQVYWQLDTQNGYTLVDEMLVGSVEDCR
jgi:hypothetical protein